MENCSSTSSYQDLPEPIIFKILSYLPLASRLHAALTCRRWYCVFDSPQSWDSFNVQFYTRQDTRFLQCLRTRGRLLCRLTIELDQFHNVNRVNALEAIRLLTSIPNGRLSQISIVCTGENPLFYAGKELVTALENLFSEPPGCLTYVDLSHFPMMIDSKTIDILSEHNPLLEYLNIQNENLVCNVSTDCMLRLAQRCRRLHVLCLHKCSLSDQVMLTFADSNRCPLHHLSIKCRSEDMHINNPQTEKGQFTSELWRTVSCALPSLRVSLHFDQTCPLALLPIIMKPEVPCSVLRLETFTITHGQVMFAAEHYSHTLEKLVVQSPPGIELERALLEVSRRCSKLRALHVFCPISTQTIDTILHEHPQMRQSGLFTLRSERGTDGPWATDEKVEA